MTNGNFHSFDECREVRRKTTELIVTKFDELSVVEVQRLVRWVLPNDPEMDQEVWDDIATKLRKRWDSKLDDASKDQVGHLLLTVLQQRIGVEPWLDFLRTRWKAAPKDYAKQYAQALYNGLTSQRWTAKFQAESFSMLPHISENQAPNLRLIQFADNLLDWSNTMERSRYGVLNEDIEHSEELTRIELARKKRAHRKMTRLGLAEFLKKSTGDANKDFQPWLNAERLYREIQVGTSIAKTQPECWQHLEAASVAKKKGSPLNVVTHLSPEIALRDRFLGMLLYLNTRPSAKQPHIKRLLAYLVEQGRDVENPQPWQNYEFKVLVALDRVEAIKARLQAWIGLTNPMNQWRLALGYVHAELGELDDAIRQFEFLESIDELKPTEYEALSKWYMIKDRRADHDRALIASFATTPEYVLQNKIQQHTNLWNRGGKNVPSELDREVLLMFNALFKKSSYPQNYNYMLQRLYQATRDFRVLEVLPDAVVGHTKVKVYPFLQTLTRVTNEVRDEATADSILARINLRRPEIKSTTDHRALDLLEMMIERRCSEVLNQPGTHGEKALAAMQRAFKREWSNGEPRLMSDLLRSLGRITQRPLAAEQVRELQVLMGREKEGAFDRLHIAHNLAQCQNFYGRTDTAIDLLRAEIAVYEDANGRMPSSLNYVLSTYITYLESKRHYVRGENDLNQRLKESKVSTQKTWLKQRLYQLYQHAMSNNGQVSFAAGKAIFNPLLDRLEAELDHENSNHRYQMINRMCQVYQAAKHGRIEGRQARLTTFAFKRLPKVMVRQTNYYNSIVQQVARTVQDVVSPMSAL